MIKRTTDSAIAELNALIGQIDGLKKEERNSANHVRWGVGTLEFLEQVFGQNSRFYLSFAEIKWYRTGSFLVSAFDAMAEADREHQEAYVRALESARGLLLGARDALERGGIESVYEGKNTGPEASELVKVLKLVEQKLRKLIRPVPTTEKEVQDAFENLLVGADVPYEREGPTIEYSSKKYRPDFSFERVNLIVELKLCADPKREKELIAEINDDILAYGTKFGNLIFVVYDTGHIRDVEKFASSFESGKEVIVRVVKH